MSARPPPHPGKFDCDCIACDAWRIAKLRAGSLVLPIQTKPGRYGGVHGLSFWHGSDHILFNDRFSVEGPTGIFIGFVERGHLAAYLKGCWIFVPGPGMGLGITMAHKLVTPLYRPERFARGHR